MSAERLAARLVPLLVEACAPERIVLFGSQAKGRADATSDVDVLVVTGRACVPFGLPGELRQLLHSMALPVDLHVATLHDVQAAANAPHGFLASILSSGRIVYEKTPTTSDRSISIVQFLDIAGTGA